MLALSIPLTYSASFADINDAIALFNEKNYKQAYEIFQSPLNIANPLAQYYLAQMYYNGLGVQEDKERSFELISLAAQNGLLEGKLSHAEMLLKGDGTPRNYKKASEEFKLLSNEGVPRAQYFLGHIYYHGLGVLKNKERAFGLFSLSAKAGNLDAQLAQAEMLLNGEGTEKDFELAEQLYHSLADQGMLTAQLFLGIMHEQGTGIASQVDYQEAAKWYKMAALQGSSAAQMALGSLYLYYELKDDNFSTSKAWLDKARELGEPKASYYLGLMYQYGKGISKNSKQALKLYLEAAEHGVPEAQYALGQIYYTGSGVPKDLERGIEWYTKAAMQNYPDAQTTLGILYYLGQNVPKDIEKSELLFTKAWDNQDPMAIVLYSEIFNPRDLDFFSITNTNGPWGLNAGEIDFENIAKLRNEYIKKLKTKVDKGNDPDAFCEYANLYHSGLEKLLSENPNEELDEQAVENNSVVFSNEKLTPNYSQSIYWYSKAAEMGHAKARFYLGLIYLLGQGVPIDQKKGEELCTAAARQNCAEAKKFLAVCYYKGIILNKNLVLSHCWATLSYDYSMLLGNSILKRITFELSNLEKIQGEKLAIEIFGKYLASQKSIWNEEVFH